MTGTTPRHPHHAPAAGCRSSGRARPAGSGWKRDGSRLRLRTDRLAIDLD